MIASPEQLYDFTGVAMVLRGHVKLPLTIGDSNRQATVMADFLIIDCPSAYNVIMERPTMNNLNLVVSIRALTIKFPTSNGTGNTKGE